MISMNRHFFVVLILHCTFVNIQSVFVVNYTCSLYSLQLVLSTPDFVKSYVLDIFFGYYCILYHILILTITCINYTHTSRYPVGDSIRSGRIVYQSKHLQNRVIEARNFVSQFDLSWPVAVDDPELGDPFNSVYASWPTRFYIMLDCKMSFIGQPNMQHVYELRDLKARLLEIVTLDIHR